MAPARSTLAIPILLAVAACTGTIVGTDPDSECDAGPTEQTACGNGDCETGETCQSCAEDCTDCVTCPDGVCDTSEDCSTCSADCGACPPVCGDGVCEGGESCSTCPADCGACPPVCGDSACEGDESCSTCPGDCGACPPVCGDGVCEGGESCSTCPGDCAGPGTYYVNPGESIQAAMDLAQAYAHCLSPTWPNHASQDALQGTVVLNPGTHYLAAPLRTRAHVRIEAYGATVVRTGGSHMMYVDDNGGGGYNAPPYWTIAGGVWDANGGGGFSIVHTLKFVMTDMEIRNIGYKAHHLEINSSGGPYQPGLYNVVVRNVTLHGVAPVHRLADEAINIDYSWIGAAHNVAGDGTVTNNVLVQGCTFYDVPRAVSSHHFQEAGGAPAAKMSGITIQGCSFHDIDPSLAESGSAFANDGAVRAYGWQNVVVESNTFTRVATAVTVYAPSDFPASLGSLGNFVIRNNTMWSCGRAWSAGANVPIVYVNSALAGVNFWDVVITGNAVAGDWIAGDVYFVAVYDTHNCAITGNHFAPTAYSLAKEKAHNKYTAQGSTNFGTWNLSGNTVSDGTVDNS